MKPEALVTGQTEGLKGGFKEWVVKPRFYKDKVFKVGLQKLITDFDMRNGHKGGL